MVPLEIHASRSSASSNNGCVKCGSSTIFAAAPKMAWGSSKMRSSKRAASDDAEASTRTETTKLPGWTLSWTAVVGTPNVAAICARYAFASNESMDALIMTVVCTVLGGTRRAYKVGGAVGGDGGRGDGCEGGCGELGDGGGGEGMGVVGGGGCCANMTVAPLAAPLATPAVVGAVGGGGGIGDADGDVEEIQEEDGEEDREEDGEEDDVVASALVDDGWVEADAEADAVTFA